MNAAGYSVEITNLSANATKKDVYDFFAFCGAIQNVDIVRDGEYVCKAYVTFRNPHAVETAVLLSGDTILDQPLCIRKSGYYNEDEHNLSNRSSLKTEDKVVIVPSPSKAVSLAQETAKKIATKGYVLGKDALGKAKAFDESHHISANAVAKVAELGQGIHLTDKISAGVEAARTIDQRYCISGATKSAFSATRKSAICAATGVVNSDRFSKGAVWLSGALSKASQVAADIGSHGVTK